MADMEATKAAARAATDLLTDKSFQQAILDLRKQWFAQLMIATKDDGEAGRLIAQLRALEAIPLQLQTYVNNAKMLEKH
jgi:hypothetical protein